MQVNTTTSRVSIGIDAAVVASHQVAIRGEVRDDFRVAPTLAGLAKLTERLEPFAGTLVVAEPTSYRWLTRLPMLGVRSGLSRTATPTSARPHQPDNTGPNQRAHTQ